MWTKIMFYNVTSEDDLAFVLLLPSLQLRILKMTMIQQWRKMNFSAFIPYFFGNFIPVFWFS